MKKLCFSCRKIFLVKELRFPCRIIIDKKNIGSRSRIFKVSVSEGVVSVSNGQVSVSDDEVLVSVSDDETETPWLVQVTELTNKSQTNIACVRENTVTVNIDTEVQGKVIIERDYIKFVNLKKSMTLIFFGNLVFIHHCVTTATQYPSPSIAMSPIVFWFLAGYTTVCSLVQQTALFICH